MSLVNYIYLATILFCIGGAAVLTRRNAIIVFMGVELMLNAANLAFVTFARMHGNIDGRPSRSSSGSWPPPKSSSGWPSSWRSSAPAARPRSTTRTC